MVRRERGREVNEKTGKVGRIQGKIETTLMKRNWEGRR